jgi:hypothetical protein
VLTFNSRVDGSAGKKRVRASASRLSGLASGYKIIESGPTTPANNVAAGVA